MTAANEPAPIGEICSTWTPVVELPGGEVVAVGSWAHPGDADRWGQSMTAHGQARVLCVVPLVQPGDLMTEMRRRQHGMA